MADAYIGEIRLFAGNYPPYGWDWCLGQSYSIAQNQTLYSILGRTYGGTSTTFNLPDFRGRVPMGFGQSPGLSYQELGQLTGEVNVGIAPSHTPVHSHSVKGKKTSSSAGQVNDPSAHTWTSLSLANKIYANSSTMTTPVAMNQACVNQAPGAGLAHSNIQPCLGVYYIICTIDGYYPVTE